MATYMSEAPIERALGHRQRQPPFPLLHSIACGLVGLIFPVGLILLDEPIAGAAVAVVGALVSLLGKQRPAVWFGVATPLVGLLVTLWLWPALWQGGVPEVRSVLPAVPTPHVWNPPMVQPASQPVPAPGEAQILPHPTMPAAVTVVVYPKVYANPDGTLYEPGATALPYVTPIPLMVAPGSYRVAYVGGVPCVVVGEMRVCDAAGLDAFKEQDYAWRLQHGQMGTPHSVADEDRAKTVCNVEVRLVVERDGVPVGEVTGVGCDEVSARANAERLAEGLQP